jgi:predicted nicotinamide N-methyase
MTNRQRDTNRRFVLAHTRLECPPLVPEIQLHLASDVMKLWEETQTHAEAEPAGLTALPPPYWAFAWPGGQALARYVLDRPETVAGKRVLDFGAGSGLVAIAAALAGANAQAAEIDPLAVAAIGLNADANAVAVGLVCEDVIGTASRWDAVLAGDVCYERPLAARLIPWLRALAANGVAVFMGDPGRAYFPDGDVAPIANYTVRTSLDLEDRERRETSAYRLV